VFLITRHGRDVYVPKYPVIEMILGRGNKKSSELNHSRLYLCIQVVGSQAISVASA